MVLKLAELVPIIAHGANSGKSTRGTSDGPFEDVDGGMVVFQTETLVLGMRSRNTWVDATGGSVLTRSVLDVSRA
jgi:hypothetical protein